MRSKGAKMNVRVFRVKFIPGSNASDDDGEIAFDKRFRRVEREQNTWLVVALANGCEESEMSDDLNEHAVNGLYEVASLTDDDRRFMDDDVRFHN